MNQQQIRSQIQTGADELDAGLGIAGEVVFSELRQRAARLNE